MTSVQTKEKPVLVMDGRDDHDQQAQPFSTDGKIVTILSIDGGGIRGVIPAIIIEFLEKHLQKIDNNKTARIADYFDVIAGTSTGSIMTGILAAPDEMDPPRPRFNASKIISFYEKEGRKIFSKESLTTTRELRKLKIKAKNIRWFNFCGRSKYFIKRQWVWTKSYFWKSKYDGTALQEVIQEKLEDIQLDGTIKHVVIPAFNLKSYRPFVFSTDQTRKLSESNYEGVLLSNVILSSAAAPTYFPPHSFKFKGKTNSFADGGLAANNPALLALCEATKLYGSQADYSNYLVLSLGTGRLKKSFLEKFIPIGHGGYIQWLMFNIFSKNKMPRLFEFLFNSISDMVEIYMTRIFNGRDIYLRIQEYELKDKHSPINDASQANIDKLKELGNDLLNKPHSIINPDTGLPEEQADSYKDALIKFAEKLSHERKRRQGLKLPEKQGTCS